MIFRVLLALCALTLMIYFGAIGRKHPLQVAGISITFVVLMIFSLAPELSTEIAQRVGVGRGVDLALYVAIVFLLTFTFNLYLGQRERGEQLVLLGRRIARDAAQTPQRELDMSQVAVVPMYQEEEVIVSVLEGVIQAGFTVILVDDGSTDRGGDHIRSLIADQQPVIFIQHPINLGQGAALMTGFEEATSRAAEYVVTFDSDGQHSPQDALRLVEELRKNPHLQVILGSRFLGSSKGMPKSRALLLKLAILFTRMTGGPQLTDSHNGLRAIRGSALSRLHLRQARMAHASELLHLIKHQNLIYKESPVTITYTERSLAKGQSVWGALSILRDLIVARLTRGQ